MSVDIICSNDIEFYIEQIARMEEGMNAFKVLNVKRQGKRCPGMLGVHERTILGL